MHSFDAPSGTTFHHNGDFSGNVYFDKPTIDGQIGFAIPFADVKALVAKHVRDERIRRVENGDDYSVAKVVALEMMDDDEVLGID